MEVQFNNGGTPVCVAAHPHIANRLAIGFVDGNIGIYDIKLGKSQLRVLGGNKLKQAVRNVVFSDSGAYFYSICENRSLCAYDLMTMERVRCIRESHIDKPCSLCYLPSTSSRNQQISTGTEAGEIKTWDLRSSNPLVSTYHEQEDDINGFALYKSTLLAASSDGTLAAYELRKQKLLVRSETMHSELLCVSVGNNSTYVGSGDGYLEVFKNDEYGNIIERIPCQKGRGVDCLKILKPSVILTASCEEDELKLFNLKPFKKLNIIGLHEEGVDDLEISCDGTWVSSVGFMHPTVKFWDLTSVMRDLPLIRADDISKKKNKREAEVSGFFNELYQNTAEGENLMSGDEAEATELSVCADESESLSEESALVNNALLDRNFLVENKEIERDDDAFSEEAKKKEIVM